MWETLVEVVREVAPDIEVVVVGDQLRLGHHSSLTALGVVTRSSVTPSVAARLVGDDRARGAVVVSDLIHEPAKDLLRDAGWSYWDRRGRLRLWVPEVGLRLDVPTRAFVAGADGPHPMRPVAGRSGLAVAVCALQHPADPSGVREVAALAHMAPSSISRARQHLIEASLLEPGGAPVVPELFWATSDAWVVRAEPVDRRPGGDGWVDGGDAAAAAFGAPVLATRSRSYSTDRADYDRHRIRHGADDEPAEIALAPTPVVVTTSVGGMVHPVVAALDLSTSSRGREVLAAWRTIQRPVPGAEVVWE